jgi:hypothetical protein
VDTKQCSKCKEVKPFSDFNKSISGTNGLHNYCRPCEKIVRRRWYLDHREEKLVKNKIWAQSSNGKVTRRNRAKIAMKAWRQKPHNKIAANLRTRVHQVMKGIRKINSTEQLTGCSFNELKLHLESLFQDGMTWDNYGAWHIDHKRPCASFDLTKPEQQLECFHYSNLQPLWAIDNLRKSDKIQ